MRVQKLKNYYSNKGAPSTDVAKQIIKTEVVRHLFTGGKLNADGTVCASEKVLQEASSCQSYRRLLGIEEPVVPTGQCSSSSPAITCVDISQEK